MDKRELTIGDVVQICPEHDDVFGGCFLVISEPKTWGAQGYCAAPGQKGLAYYRCKFENMEFVGHAVWVNSSDAAAEESGSAG
jgi:hypothetical protein